LLAIVAGILGGCGNPSNAAPPTVRYPPAAMPAPQHERWLSDVGGNCADRGLVRVGTVIARRRGGRAAARDMRAYRGRGPSVSW